MGKTFFPKKCFSFAKKSFIRVFPLQTSFLLCRNPLVLDDCGRLAKQQPSILKKQVCSLALSGRLKTFAFAVGFVFFSTSSLPQKQIKLCVFPYRQVFLWQQRGKYQMKQRPREGETGFAKIFSLHKNVQHIFCFKHLPRLPVVFNLLSRL